MVATDERARSDLLLDREAELATIDELVASVPGGTGRILVVEGPGGIGKTRLLAAAKRRAEGMRLQVLTARCGEFERDFSFSLVRQLFEPPLRDLPRSQREELLSGAAAPAGR